MILSSRVRRLTEWRKKERSRIGLLAGVSLAAMGLCLSLVPAGCAKKPDPALEARSYVEQKLRDAAEAISHDLSLLTGSSNRDFDEPLAVGGLAEKMDLIFDGPLEAALARVAARSGYRLDIQGEAPQSPLLVHLRMKDRPCLDILRELGMQTGSREGIVVSEVMKTITLTYKE